ncbi:glyoxalase superfamily protein [Leeuwenhoekiella sp. MAR_2009_132]|uniref:glyoxalase superfamily protein n=1 Tax=Leeuwenhoekiella sp. MAR_2009_132 TaxID=1392489 RepID=UPI00048F1007|nr:glyoxalase/bleomycin resistance/extradiol dioxygenase family protein [Leeuwenhoekiella sp. MAR_2009_132]
MGNSTEALLTQITPVLYVSDVLEALEFYLKKLGFDLVFIDEERNPNYAGIRRNKITIHFKRFDLNHLYDNSKNSTIIRIHVQTIEKLFKEYRLMCVFNNHTSLEEKPWGSLEFTIYDPFKNELVFYQMI